MTLVQNHLPPLSGNKWLIVAFAGLLLAACSPKVRPVSTPVKHIDTVVKKPAEVKVTPPPAAAKPVISLILPFHLDELNLQPGAGHAGVAKADLAVEFYQGFKLALDSLTVNNYSFKLQVYDSKDENTQTRSLALYPKVRAGDVVIGPVYPEGVRSFTNAFGGLKKILVSPLSPTPPADYKYPGLVTMIPPLEYHARKVAAYLNATLKPKKVFILKSGYNDDNKYSIPFKKALDSLSKKRIKIIELTVVRGDLTSLMPQLSLTEQNVFVIPATDQKFVQVTLRSLDLLVKQRYPVTLFGHPTWEKETYLKPEQLQRLNTYITSSDRINYHAANVVKFLKDFRRMYHAEPSEFAIKGYDEGMYWGRFINTPGQTIANFGDYEGLHNTFHFININGLGYVNSHVKLYKYTNFELKSVE
jgi:ABC-type branched-subunit amino acid transport system substrate-binding protein